MVIIMECPNCISIDECKGIHISYITDKVYRSEYGYFMFREDKSEWVFTPLEKDLDVNILMDLADILRNFNENLEKENYKSGR
jgi:hypothetical protein